MFEKMSPARLEKMSVNRPARGWRAALAMRYAEASQDRSVKELNDVEMGADSVAMTVESTAGQLVLQSVQGSISRYPMPREIHQPICCIGLSPAPSCLALAQLVCRAHPDLRFVALPRHCLDVGGVY